LSRQNFSNMARDLANFSSYGSAGDDINALPSNNSLDNRHVCIRIFYLRSPSLSACASRVQAAVPGAHPSFCVLITSFAKAAVSNSVTVLASFYRWRVEHNQRCTEASPLDKVSHFSRYPYQNQRCDPRAFRCTSGCSVKEACLYVAHKRTIHPTLY
jgi:hypothetical protein